MDNNKTGKLSKKTIVWIVVGLVLGSILIVIVIIFTVNSVRSRYSDLVFAKSMKNNNDLLNNMKRKHSEAITFIPRNGKVILQPELVWWIIPNVLHRSVLKLLIPTRMLKDYWSTDFNVSIVLKTLALFSINFLKPKEDKAQEILEKRNLEENCPLTVLTISRALEDIYLLYPKVSKSGKKAIVENFTEYVTCR